MKQKKNIVNFISHAIFWLLVAWFFVKNSFLRPLTVSAPYKEIVCVLMIAIMVYFNYLYLIPNYFQKGKRTKFWIFTLLTILFVGIFEFILTKPNTYQCYSNSLNPEEMKKFLFSVMYLIMIRDACFFLFFFMLKLHNDLSYNHLKESQFIAKHDKTLLNALPHGEIYQINISNIVYISQSGNYASIHLSDGKIDRQYSSLKGIQEILPDEICVKINRNNLIMLSKVVDYNDYSVTLDLKEGDNNLTLPISSNLRQTVLLKLRKFKQETSEIILEKGGMEATKSGISTEDGVEICLNYDENTKESGINEGDSSPISEGKSENSEKFKFNPTQKAILEYLSINPNHRIPAIAKGIYRSPNTVENNMKILVEQELVEFRGAKRTGGYFIKKDAL